MTQLTLNLEPGVTVRNRSLKECVAAGIYSRGVVAVAGKLDISPSHLSEALSGGGRKLDVDDLERYIEVTGDLSPIHYLVSKFLRDPAAQQQEALAVLAKLAETLPGLLSAAGLAPAAAPKTRR
jgi:hypothetical protein